MFLDGLRCLQSISNPVERPCTCSIFWRQGQLYQCKLFFTWYRFPSNENLVKTHCEMDPNSTFSIFLTAKSCRPWSPWATLPIYTWLGGQTHSVSWTVFSSLSRNSSKVPDIMILFIFLLILRPHKHFWNSHSDWNYLGVRRLSWIPKDI